MLAYVELVQKPEKDIGCDVLTHQKWSGASYVDRILQSKLDSLQAAKTALTAKSFTGISSGSSSTSATGADSTENQFH